MNLSAKVAKLENTKKALTVKMEEIHAAKECDVPEGFQAVLQDTLLGFDLQLNHISYLAVLGQNEQRIAKEIADIDVILNRVQIAMKVEEPAPVVPTANHVLMCDPVLIEEKQISAKTLDNLPLNFVIKRVYIKDSFLVVVSEGGYEYATQFSSKEKSKAFNSAIRASGLIEESGHGYCG